VYLALGANLGDRAANLRRALDLLEPDCGPLASSPIFETPPWGDLDQPPFLNMVARGVTWLAPHALLARLKVVEREVGRRPTRRWGPRVVDVDVLTYGDAVVDDPELTIPHARLHERAFVLVPLAALDPGWRHPTLHRTAAGLLAALPAAERAGITRWKQSQSSQRRESDASAETDTSTESCLSRKTGASRALCRSSEPMERREPGA
jgi:2-amino-4-hydroxy-6-hydroxymethyldihydropteridine diphosphokinase